MPTSATDYGAYKQVGVETASQGKLIIMLFNGAINRAKEARKQIEKGKCEGVHNNLIRAQDIVAELRGSLDMKVGVSENLDRLYEYVQHLLIKANIRKDIRPIDECIEHLTSLRDTWEEAFESLAAEEKIALDTPKSDAHGAGVINIQG